MKFRETHGWGGNGPATACSLSRSSRLRPGVLRAPAASAASAPRELSRGPEGSSAATWDIGRGRQGQVMGHLWKELIPRLAGGAVCNSRPVGCAGRVLTGHYLPARLGAFLGTEGTQGGHTHIAGCTIQTPPWRGLYSLAVPLTGVPEAAATFPGHILETHSGAHPRPSGSSDSLGGKLSASTKAPSHPWAVGTSEPSNTPLVSAHQREACCMFHMVIESN